MDCDGETGNHCGPLFYCHVTRLSWRIPRSAPFVRKVSVGRRPQNEPARDRQGQAAAANAPATNSVRRGREEEALNMTRETRLFERSDRRGRNCRGGPPWPP